MLNLCWVIIWVKTLTLTGFLDINIDKKVIKGYKGQHCKWTLTLTKTDRGATTSKLKTIV